MEVLCDWDRHILMAMFEQPYQNVHDCGKYDRTMGTVVVRDSGKIETAEAGGDMLDIQYNKAQKRDT